MDRSAHAAEAWQLAEAVRRTAEAVRLATANVAEAEAEAQAAAIAWDRYIATH
jgi:hypothetical protein